MGTGRPVHTQFCVDRGHRGARVGHWSSCSHSVLYRQGAQGARMEHPHSSRTVVYREGHKGQQWVTIGKECCLDWLVLVARASGKKRKEKKKIDHALM